MKTLILSLAFFAFLHVVEAQDTTTYKSNKINDLKWVPLPAVGSNPANGWMFGLAPSATWYMGNPADTKMSNREKRSKK